MSNQICLKWNSFLSNIATSFESLWEEEGLVDVTLASDGQCLTAHKVILSASSPFFKKVFQTNPCQHPVIILQDVHFSELEALLIFIYKGEVNIEQKNLPALLKAAETLQIRGLSGGDIFAKESYKRLVELEQAVTDDIPSVKEEVPKKKLKVSKQQNNSILEKALTPRISQSENTSESTASDHSGKDVEYMLSEHLPNPLYQRLEMKVEPLEMTVDDLQKGSPSDKDPTERLDTEQIEGTQGTSQPLVTVIAEARLMSNCPSDPEECDDPLDESNNGNSSKTPDKPPENTPQEESTCEPTITPNLGSSNNSDLTPYPPFPCPFCDRAYTSWGFRRRHIKAVHTISQSLSCKWCCQVLPTHSAWRRHVISAHKLSASDAHNGLLILEEAHMVLQVVHPTKLGTLVNIIKQNSKQTSGQNSSQPDKG